MIINKLYSFLLIDSSVKIHLYEKKEQLHNENMNTSNEEAHYKKKVTKNKITKHVKKLFLVEEVVNVSMIQNVLEDENSKDNRSCGPDTNLEHDSISNDLNTGEQTSTTASCTVQMSLLLDFPPFFLFLFFFHFKVDSVML